MESIANPLYFFSNLPVTPQSCSDVVRFIDVLEFFFVAHPLSGRKEGEEHNRVMYFHPKGEQLERQTEITGFAEAVANFTENFLNTPLRDACEKVNENGNEFDYRTVSTQKTEQIYICTEDQQFILGVSLSKQLSHVSDYPLYQPAIRSILSDAYKMFRMFFGTFSSFINVFPDDVPKLKKRLDLFFSKYIPLLKVHKMPLLDHFGGVEFLRMSGPLYLNVVSLLSELQEEFPIIEKIMILYQNKLLYYRLSKRDLPSLFRYLAHDLLPKTLAPELEHSGRHVLKGRYLRGPTDLTTDAPLLGDESLPVVHLHSEHILEDEVLSEYQMMVYRCLNATVCMFVKNCTSNEEYLDKRGSDSSQSSTTYSSATQNGVVSRRLLRNIDQFLETELAQIASKIGDEVDDEKLAETIDFHYIYFNPSSLSMTSSLSTSQSLSVSASVPTSTFKVPLPPVEVNRLVCDTMSNFVSDSEEFGECFVKSTSDWWIVIKKVNDRLLVLILPPSSFTTSLADVQSKAAVIVRSHFEAIFFS